MTLPIAKLERPALADALVASGPDAPTLCEGWSAYDLVAHLVVRENKPIATIGIVAASLGQLHERAIERTKLRSSFESLVERFRSGPPLAWKLVDDLFNGQEFFIHHEDLRRGGGNTEPRPAEEIAGIEDQLWRLLERGKRFAVRGIKDVGVELTRPDGAAITARRGEPKAIIAGRPGEILLYLSGRKSAAHVELRGDPDAIAQVEAARLGI
ncbi:MAG: TIGR03085 family metal-binding protein [Acidimicrobiales bacterium]|nr:TIGR03085 family metal-binding protein [Acidimicrobiales bacterium]